MKVHNITKIFTSMVLVLITLVMSTGCGNIANGVVNNNRYERDYYGDYRVYASNVSSEATQDYIKLVIEDDLQENLTGYNVDYVECIYISQEYIDEVYYNSLDNIYFGHDYDEISSYMQGTNWCFTVNEKGQTVVTEVRDSSSALADTIKKVAIGTGVILVCVVISCATSGAGTPVACFFAGAAKGALVSAVSGAAVSGVIGGVVEGVQTKSWDGALKGAMTSAADGYMWGAISGALIGGFSSAACFEGDTLVKTDDGYKPISKISVGDEVYSYNEHTGLYDYKPVTETYKKIANDTIKISVNGQEIITTETHPFYSASGWVEAKDLTRGSLLLTDDGYSPVETVEYYHTNEETWVYNLTVAYNHTYTVSEDDVVVHNACGDSTKLRNALKAEGDVAPEYPNAAHHIVPSSDKRFTSSIRLKEKFDSLGLGINEPYNGVFLSTSKNVTGTTYHRTLHSEEYYS